MSVTNCRSQIVGYKLSVDPPPHVAECDHIPPHGESQSLSPSLGAPDTAIRFYVWRRTPAAAVSAANRQVDLSMRFNSDLWALEAPGPRVGKLLMRAIAWAHQYRAQSNSCTSFERALHGL